jgi:site-specific recombinase XerD
MLITAGERGLAERVAELQERSAEYAAQAYGEGTRAVYRRSGVAYQDWCRRHARAAYDGDPETVALYITDCAERGFSVSTIRIHLAAIRTAHKLVGVPLDLSHPRLAMVREGIARSKGVAPRRRAAAAVPDVLRAMLGTRQPATAPAGARDRAMLLIGFGAGLRRSELVGLHIGDVEIVPGRGLRVNIRRSKTDQRGTGCTVNVCANPKDPDFCPAEALDRWMEHRSAAADGAPPDGPLFCGVRRSGRLKAEPLCDQTVALLVKDAARKAGYDPTSFSGHSLRRGLVTTLAGRGASLSGTMEHVRHADPKNTMIYIEQQRGWESNVTGLIFGGERP